MNKIIKTTLIMGLVLFICGAVALFTVYAVNGFDFKSISPDRQTFEKRTYCKQLEVDSVKIENANGEVIIERSQDLNVYVEYEESEDVTYSFGVEENLLTIRQNAGEWYDNIFKVSLRRSTLKVKIPESVSNSVKISNNNGTITVKNQSLDKLKVVSDNGSVRIEQVNCKNVVVQTDNGKITLEKIACDNANLSTHNGEVKTQFFGNSDDYAFDVSTNNGRSNVNSKSGLVENKIIRIVTHNGNITVDFS